MKKAIADLTVEDLSRHPIWDYFEDRKGRIVVVPVRQTPVRSLRGRLLGCQVALGDGQKQWATLSNIHLKNQSATSQFLTLAITKNGKWFHLARYFDVDYA